MLHGSSTMVRLQLDERQWHKVKAALGVRNRAGRPGRDDRNFVEAVLWWRRTGAPWRDLPSDFGPWKTVFNRFDRWASKGIWQRLFEPLRQDPDVTRITSCLRQRRLRGQLPAARACLARATNPGLPAKNTPTVTYGPSGTGTGTADH